MMLLGIVKKNAIMQIDFAVAAERTEMKSPVDAIYEGCLVRFRSDYDDHDRRDAGRGADGAGLGRGRRSPASARTCRGRRSILLAVGDFVFDAGGLHVFRRDCGAVEKMERRRNSAGAAADTGEM